MSEETDDDGEERDADLRGRGVPEEVLDEKLQAEVVDSEVERHNHDVTRQLASTVQCGAGEGDILIEPKTRQQSDGEHDAEGGDVRSQT